MFKRKRLLYRDLKPGDRIRKLVEEYIEPEMSKHGFMLLKSDLTFKRKIDGFTQEIHIAKHQRNVGSTHVKFWVIISVKSTLYAKWHEKSYGVKPLNDIVNSWYDNQLTSWSIKYKKAGHYDLVKFDNVKLMMELTKNITEVGIPMVNDISDWEKAADYIMREKQYGDFSKAFDFYVLAGRANKAHESISFVEGHFESIKNVPIERFEEIKLRKNTFN